MIQSYSDNCDYLRKRFKVSELASLYELVSVVTDYIRDLDAKEEAEKAKEALKDLSELKTETISKEKKNVKRGRKQKSNSS